MGLCKYAWPRLHCVGVAFWGRLPMSTGALRCLAPLGLSLSASNGERGLARGCSGAAACVRAAGGPRRPPQPRPPGTPRYQRGLLGGGWDCPGVPALLTLLRPPPQGTPPRSALRPRNPGGRRRPRTSRSGPGRGLWGRCTPQPSWLSCSISVCRCGETRGGDARGLNFPGGR